MISEKAVRNFVVLDDLFLVVKENHWMTGFGFP